ncbi:MAG: HlyD family secretion protein [Methylococcales bacterium]|nr:HlyD family secretion protein [Methylococcales bacterium]
MKPRHSRFLMLALFIGLAAASGVYLHLHRGEESTDDAMLDGHNVTISPKVSGYVKTLNIDDNQLVKAGDVLLEIDPSDYIFRRDKAQAAFDAAQAAAMASKNNMETTNISAPSNRDAAQAQVDAARANWDKALKDLKRMQRLTDEARSQNQLEQAVAAEMSAKSAFYEAEARLRTANTAPRAIAAARAMNNQLLAQLKQAQADLEQAENDLANTRLIAPMNGRITNRGVERGNYVQPGQQLGYLVSTETWVIANFKETQLKNMRPGQRVAISIDAYPDKVFNGRVDSIQAGAGAFFSAFPPQNATGNFVKIVQRVPVKIVFDPIPDSTLTMGPGMSVEPVVYTLKPSDR